LCGVVSASLSRGARTAGVHLRDGQGWRDIFVRSDMFEVIIERPRYGSSWATKKGRRGERTARAFDRAPIKMGMGRSGGTKQLNENLAPLVRFLRKSVGRPWNKVRSEMCEVLSMSSTVQKHVMDHVRDFVEQNPRMIDGVPHAPIAFGGAKGTYRPLSQFGRWRSFYVCPKTGLLCWAARPGRRKSRQR
jgi:hypothetical protein